MKVWIIVCDRAEQAVDSNLGLEFFPNLTVNGLFPAFARFELPAGEFIAARNSP